MGAFSSKKNLPCIEGRFHWAWAYTATWLTGRAEDWSKIMEPFGKRVLRHNRVVTGVVSTYSQRRTVWSQLEGPGYFFFEFEMLSHAI